MTARPWRLPLFHIQGLVDEHTATEMQLTVHAFLSSGFHVYPASGNKQRGAPTFFNRFSKSSESLGFWALSIIQNSKYMKTRRFGN
jgi:hypothetical protein